MSALPPRRRPGHDSALDALASASWLFCQHQDVLAALDRAVAARYLADRIRSVTGTDVTLVGLLETPDVMLRHWSGTRQAGLHDLAIPAGYGLAGQALTLHRPIWASDYVSSPVFTHHATVDQPVRAEGLRAMLAVPMIHGGEILGVIYTALRSHAHFGDQAIQSVEEAAQGAAFAMRLASHAETQADVAVQSERHRVAAALHDTVGANLFAIGAEVRDLSETYAASPALLGRLKHIERQIAAASTALRHSMAALSDTEPADDLSVTLADDTYAFQARTGVRARVVVLGELPVLDAAARHALVTAAREGLRNVEKHAQASFVAVSVAATRDRVHVTVADDGRGWPTAGAREDERLAATSSALGLPAASARLERVGGGLSVTANEDAGLSLMAWVPLP